MEAQVERFAPGFRERILARHVLGPADLQARNANLVGGDVGGGSYALRPGDLPTGPIARSLPHAGARFVHRQRGDVPRVERSTASRATPPRGWRSSRHG